MCRCGVELGETALSVFHLALDLGTAALVVGQVHSAVGVGVEQPVDPALRTVDQLGQSPALGLLWVAWLALRGLCEGNLGGVLELGGVALQPQRDSGLDRRKGAVGPAGFMSSAVLGRRLP